MKKNALIKKYAPKGLPLSPKTIRDLVKMSVGQKAEDERSDKIAETFLDEIGAGKVDWKTAKTLKNGDKKSNVSRDLAKLNDLIGCTITNIGIVDVEQLPGRPYIEGGLIIDYHNDVKGLHNRRIVLGYNELGTWVHWQGNR